MEQQPCYDKSPQAIHLTADTLHTRIILWQRSTFAVQLAAMLYSLLLLFNHYDITDLHHDAMEAMLWLQFSSISLVLLMMFQNIEKSGFQLYTRLRMFASGLIDHHDSLERVFDTIKNDVKHAKVFFQPLVKLIEKKEEHA